MVPNHINKQLFLVIKLQVWCLEDIHNMCHDTMARICWEPHVDVTSTVSDWSSERLIDIPAEI